MESVVTYYFNVTSSCTSLAEASTNYETKNQNKTQEQFNLFSGAFLNE